jgi:hypothetical protein
MLMPSRSLRTWSDIDFQAAHAMYAPRRTLYLKLDLRCVDFAAQYHHAVIDEYLDVGSMNGLDGIELFYQIGFELFISFHVGVSSHLLLVRAYLPRQIVENSEFFRLRILKSVLLSSGGKACFCDVLSNCRRTR